MAFMSEFDHEIYSSFQPGICLRNMIGFIGLVILIFVIYKIIEQRQRLPEVKEKAKREQIDNLEGIAYDRYSKLLEEFEKYVKENRKEQKSGDKHRKKDKSLEKYYQEKIDRRTKDIEKVEEMRAKYLRLKEKKKHDGADVLLQIAQDWYDYIRNYDGWWYGVNAWDFDSEVCEEHLISIQEIEKRFNKMLGIKKKRRKK